MFRERGVQIYGISIDSPEQNRAMIDKLLLPFDLLSDPEGETAIKPFGLWDETGRISKPALVLTDRHGVIRYLFEGRDFADRPKDEIVLKALADG
jgi:peroxiredoxin